MKRNYLLKINRNPNNYWYCVVQVVFELGHVLKMSQHNVATLSSFYLPTVSLSCKTVEFLPKVCGVCVRASCANQHHLSLLRLYLLCRLSGCWLSGEGPFCILSCRFLFFLPAGKIGLDGCYTVHIGVGCVGFSLLKQFFFFWFWLVMQ